jgi:menaquinone-dependent protoporphyrinogen oxidase
MTIAIVYASKHGATAEIAGRLAEQLDSLQQKADSAASTTLIDLTNCTDKNPDIAEFDTVILGTAFYAGNFMSSMKKFIAKAAQALSEKKIALFISGLVPDEEHQNKELTNAFPQELLDRAAATAFLGGRLRRKELSWFERMVVKKAAQLTEDVDTIDDEKIRAFAQKIL